MLDTAGELIRYIVILIFLAALLEMLLPQGIFRRYLRVFVGILLIFTLLNPIQKIMRIAPYWEMPSIEGLENKQELELILERGERLYRESMDDVSAEYHQRIFQLLENELASEFSQELIQLDIGMEENPQSSDFGVLTDIALVVRGFQSEGRDKTTGKVEEIKVSVDVTDKNSSIFTTRQPDKVSPGITGEGLQNQSVPELNRQAQAEEIRRYLSVYCGLPAENIYVTILP